MKSTNSRIAEYCVLKTPKLFSDKTGGSRLYKDINPFSIKGIINCTAVVSLHWSE